MTKEPLNPQEEILSLALGRALEAIYVQTPTSKFDELVKLYKEAENCFLMRVAGKEFFTLEIKRRVAELILYSAIEKRCSLDLCRSLLDDLGLLGFTNLEKKSSIYLIYSRYCLELGHSQEGICLLRQLEDELVDELRQTGLLVYTELLRTTREILRRFKP